MTDIAQFLAARFDEDEAAAQHSGPARVAWLTYRDDAGHMRYTTVAASNSDCDPWVADGHVLSAPASVRVVYDPARVLAEVAAKRVLLEWCTEVTKHFDWSTLNQFGSLLHDPNARATHTAVMALCTMAAPYADHPDYNQAWRVQ